MKNILSFSIAILLTMGLRAQEAKGYGVFYGMNVTEVQTGSGHNSSYVLNTNIQKGRKSLEMGIVYQDEQGRISGGDVKYKVYLGKNAFLDNLIHSEGMKLRTYMHYNCIYHSSKVNTPDFIPAGGKKTAYPELPSSPGTIATMEHYAGAGIQLIISGNFCLDASLGLGTYIGSLDKINTPSTLGIHKENHGFTTAFELGLGYKFGI